MTTAIYIIGTNCTGKSTIAREIIKREGGIENATRLCTYTNGNVALAGSYASESHCGVGVDKLGNTKVLWQCATEAFSKRSIFVAEGMLLGTFGMNTTTPILAADKQLVVFLHASAETLAQRLKKRSHTPLTRKVMERQQAIAKVADKYKEIGVPVLEFSEKYPIEVIINQIFTYI